MKYIIVLLLILLSGCSEIFNTGIDYHNSHSDYDPEYGIEKYLTEYKKPTIEESFNYYANYITNIIDYKNDINDKWQTPIETFNLKTGDCEDSAILFIYGFYKYSGLKCDMYRVYNFHSNCCHMIAVYNNLIFGFKNHPEYYYYDKSGKMSILDIYDYGTALYYAEFLK